MQGVALQLGLERPMPLQQIEGGGIKEHRGHLGVITITSIACHDHTGHTCQNLSGMGGIRGSPMPAKAQPAPTFGGLACFVPLTPFERATTRRSASATASSSDPNPGGLTMSIETPASGPS